MSFRRSLNTLRRRRPGPPLTKALNRVESETGPETRDERRRLVMDADMEAFNRKWAADLSASSERLKVKLLDAISHAESVALQEKIDGHRRQIDCIRRTMAD